jgi:hypothetical protein
MLEHEEALDRISQGPHIEASVFHLIVVIVEYGLNRFKKSDRNLLIEDRRGNKEYR